MPTFSILHLTDLHLGASGQEALIQNVTTEFLKDLSKVYRHTGPWDLVLFSGDLVFSGQKEQFDRLNSLLDKIWKHLEKLGSRNVRLLVVPGNHDLAFPDPNSAQVDILRELATTNNNTSKKWDDVLSIAVAGQYRTIINQSFEAFSNWWNQCQLKGNESPQFQYHEGKLPGDFAAIIEKDKTRLGIVGLNSTFLQLTKDNYEGKLAIHIDQFDAVRNINGMDLFDNNIDACLLMTHQPPSWLAPYYKDSVFYKEINIDGRFVAHFCGHMHEAEAEARADRWGTSRRLLLGSSLFGLEHR